tara:strand:- start:51 stop:425 length:375 start_codon:yes stop_codon:yes gene_type:complete
VERDTFWKILSVMMEVNQRVAINVDLRGRRGNALPVEQWKGLFEWLMVTFPSFYARPVVMSAIVVKHGSPKSCSPRKMVVVQSYVKLVDIRQCIHVQDVVESCQLITFSEKEVMSAASVNPVEA